jgi:hypothetical protein
MCSDSDNLHGSGVAVPSQASIIDNDNGTFTATCSAPEDGAGNFADPISVTYTVLPPQPDPGGEIVGALTESGQLSAVSTDGSDLHQVTSQGQFPIISPDKSKVAFSWVGPLSGNNAAHPIRDVWVVNADGTGLTNVTNNIPVASYPLGWSQDGSKLAVYNASDQSAAVVNADGSDYHEVYSPVGFAGRASFSPDGTKLLVGTGPTVALITLDGSAAPVTIGGGGDPQWSPDGTHFAWNGDGGIHIANADGSNPVVVTVEGGVGNFAWSPDGTEFAFDYKIPNAGNNNPSYLYRVPTIGGAPVQIPNSVNITSNGYIEWFSGPVPVFQPARLPLFPNVFANVARGPDSNGWYNAPLTISWYGTDFVQNGWLDVNPPTNVTADGQYYVQSPTLCNSEGDCGYARTFISMDQTPPVVTLTGPHEGQTYPPGQVPDITCTTTDALSGVSAEAYSWTVDNGAGSFTAYCGGASDRAGNNGNTASATYTVGIPDHVPPVVTGTPDRAANAHGWYKTPVTITWTATDPAPSSGTPTTPPPTEASTQGSNVTYTSGQSCDPNANCATGTYPLSIDAAAPTVTVTGVQDGHSYLQNSVPTAGCSTSDTLSGVAVQATLTTADNGNGTFVATCSGGKDNADNTAASVSATYTVVPPVRNVGSGSRTVSGNNSITTTIASGGVPVGDTLTVAISTGTFAGAVGCSDSAGNTYTVVVDKNTGNGRLFVCSSKLTSALANGSTVTATYPGFSGVSVVSLNEVSALATTGVVDAVNSNAGNSASPNSGNVATTVAEEVLFGFVVYNSTPTITAGSGYTAIGQVSGGSGSGERTLMPEFKLVTATGTYVAAASLNAAQQWRAAIVAYRGP